MHAVPSLLWRILDQALIQGDLDIVDDLVAMDVASHLDNWGLPGGRLGLKQMIANLRAAFPDLRCIVEDEISEKDKIAARWMIHGTHTGSLWGHQPTGRLVAVQGFAFARTADGQIVENWIFIDQMGLLQQLGVVPPPRGSV